jgi:hypothetical protein
MVIAPKLESQLQTARLGSLLPVLAELGVECTDDLELLQDGDIEKRSDLSVILKRRFLEWKANQLEVGSTKSYESTLITELAGRGTLERTTDRINCGPMSDRQRPSDPQSSRPPMINKISLPLLEATTASLPPETSPLRTQPLGGYAAGGTSSSGNTPPIPATPRTRVLPMLQVLRELEALDQALQEERERCKNLDEELQEERDRTAKLAEEKKANEEGHARDISALEEMLQHLINENKSLRATDSGRQATSPSGNEAQNALRQVADTSSASSARGSSTGEVKDRLTLTEMLYEPEMEPRKTMADRLSQIRST